MTAVAVRPDETKFKVEDLPEIWGLEIKQEWLVEDLIPDNSLVALTGESGSGKSSVVLALAAAVAQGKPFLDRTTKQKEVLIIDRENGLQVYSERFARFGVEPTPSMRFWGHWNDIQPGGPDHRAVKEYCLATKPFIIFDSLQAFGDGWNEQDASETREYMDKYRMLVGLGATVLVIHHTGKALNSKEYRGSSDIKASLDTGLVLEAKKKELKLLKLKPFKSREGVIDTTMLALEGTEFVQLSAEFIPADSKEWKIVEEIIKNNPGIIQQKAIELSKLPSYKARKVLSAGESSGRFLVSKGLKNASHYTLAESFDSQGSQS